MSMTNAFQPGQASLSEAEQKMIERRERLLGPAYRLFYEHPLHIVRGEGVWLYDADGRRYLDAYNNVAGVGHCHPRVLKALAEQAGLLNTHTRYLHEKLLVYAKALLATMPGTERQAMFTTSGSEANDLACRIAQLATGGSEFIATKLAYHGGTHLIAGLSPSLGPHAAKGPNAWLVDAPDGYRRSADVGAEFATGVKAALEGMRNAGRRPAALIVDTVFSSDGVFTDPAGFLRDAVDAVRTAGGLYIADEVQAGFGRTGSHWWGWQRHALSPDIITMGKPMGAGYPMAGLAARPPLLEGIGRSRYFSTFGGNPVAAAVGQAVLDIIRDEGLIANAGAIGEALLDGLRQLASIHDLVGDVRGAGLFIGVELVSDRRSKAPAGTAATRVVNALRERGVLISSCGPGANVLKIRPPLCFTGEHAGILLAELDTVLGTLN
ncbi:MAG: aspartate aminotransferase family protein [Gammaproteobacteria bacterium]|nr:aspartate aminotransferase family protein [Gammaproteobacteria bacterium]